MTMLLFAGWKTQHMSGACSWSGTARSCRRRGTSHRTSIPSPPQISLTRAKCPTLDTILSREDYTTQSDTDNIALLSIVIVSRTFKTASLNAALILSGILPLDLRIREAAELYRYKRGEDIDGMADRKAVQRVSFLDAPHPAFAVEVEFCCLEEKQAETEVVTVTVVAGSSTSLVIASTSAAYNPSPVSVAESTGSVTAGPMIPTSSRILQDVNINVPVCVLSPVPKGIYVTGQGKRKPRKKPSVLLLTSMPNIEETKAKCAPLPPPNKKTRKVTKVLDFSSDSENDFSSLNAYIMTSFQDPSQKRSGSGA
ncbi:unnamed protein product [Leptidea sinapis]|uniref:Uncharacterized protein n=1 Tax=Leptidea sinapis TaxID=189913 RepID=A0A5E4QNE3_9NEOP|nr:unnamed protein product [Leptidea sinapis]